MGRVVWKIHGDRARRAPCNSVLTMMKSILLALGIKAAPPPYGKYLALTSAFGITPALLFVAWKNRDRIRAALRDMKTEAPKVLEQATQRIPRAARPQQVAHA
jgi:hypothetical protein